MVSRKVMVVVAGAVLAASARTSVTSEAASGASAPFSGWHLQQYLGTCSGQVTSVTATGPADAWAAGDLCPTSNKATVAVHWDGGLWQDVRPPSPRLGYGSTAVAALSGSYAWIFAPNLGALDAQDFALLRDGRRWKSFQLANDSTIDSAVVFSRSDAWGFGTIGHGAYAVRFSGRSWRRVPIPVVPLATAAPNPDHIWAVGPAVRQAGQSDPHSYQLARWTGRWRTIPLPSPPPGGGYSGAFIAADSADGAFVTTDLPGGQGDTVGVMLKYGP